MVRDREEGQIRRPAFWCSSGNFQSDFDWPTQFHVYGGRSAWTESLELRRHSLILDQWRRVEPAFDDIFAKLARASRIRLYQYLAYQLNSIDIVVNWKSVVFAEARLTDVDFQTIAPFFDSDQSGIQLTRQEWLGAIHYLAHGDSDAQQAGLLLCS